MVSVLLQALVSQELGGGVLAAARMGLEPIMPMLELGIIETLTYDERLSYTSRFCNSRPIIWLGNISMSFCAPPN